MGASRTRRKSSGLSRQTIRGILFAVAFLLIPGCVALLRTLGHLESVAEESGAKVLALSLPFGVFLAGFMAAGIASVSLALPTKPYVAVHEATHALFGWLSFSKVSRFTVKETHGSVRVEHPTMLGLLAPYFFPLPAVAILLVFGCVSLFSAPVGTPWATVFCALEGIAWGLHFSYTVNALLQHQTDLDEFGFFFSFLFIVFLNLVFLLVLFVALTPTTCGQAVSWFGAEFHSSLAWIYDLLWGQQRL